MRSRTEKAATILHTNCYQMIETQTFDPREPETNFRIENLQYDVSTSLANTVPKNPRHKISIWQILTLDIKVQQCRTR